MRMPHSNGPSLTLSDVRRVRPVRVVSEALLKAPHRLELMALIAELAEPGLSVVQIHELMISRQVAIDDEHLLTWSSVSRNLRRLCDAGLLTGYNSPVATPEWSRAFGLPVVIS
jgi:hypothetical protein